MRSKPALNIKNIQQKSAKKLFLKITKIVYTSI